MSLSEPVSLEKAQQENKSRAQRKTMALDKVRTRFEPNDCHLAIITPELYEQIYDLIKYHFVPDEPTSISIGISWSEEYKMLIRENLRDNISFCIVHNDTKKIIGARVSGLMNRADPPLNESQLTDENLRTLVRFATQKDAEIDLFNRLNVDEVFHFYILVVHRDYRQRHIGSILLNTAVAFASELGYRGIKGEGTSKYAQKIYEKSGFDVMASLPYGKFVTPSGRTLREGTGEHSDFKIYTLKLQ